jgi:hypothetical protein
MTFIQMKFFLSPIIFLAFNGGGATTLAFQSLLSTNRLGVTLLKKSYCSSNKVQYSYKHHGGITTSTSTNTATKISSSFSSSLSPRYLHKVRQATATTTVLKLSSSPSNLNNSNERFSKKDEANKAIEKIELTNEKNAEMLEVTFIKACLQLATGYVDILKLFIAAVNAGYNRGIPIPQLIQLVAQCPNNSANRELSKDEIDLRSRWMIVSYLTLETIDRLEGNKETVGAKVDLQIPIEARDEFGPIIEEQVQKEVLGQLQDINSGKVKKTTDNQDPQAAAIFAYCLKVISLTISNVKETRLANEKTPTIDEDGVGPPRPKIPGTY